MASSLLLDGGKGVGSDWRLVVASRAAPAHATEDEQVEEVHAAEHDQNHADLDRERFHCFLRREDDVAELQRQADVAEVDEIEADDEQVIDRIGEGFVAVKDVDEK